MKRLAIAAGAVLATLATTASAQIYIERTVDPYWAARNDFFAGRHECWNPRAGHFEQVRPGEYQDDLDFSRCRMFRERYYTERTYDDRYYNRGRYYREVREECWNPRARHYEEVRPGEFQDDLDRTRCRVISWR